MCNVTIINVNKPNVSNSTFNAVGSAVRQEAFDLFMREYANTAAMATHKKALKAK